jgi:hypothetical protein
VLLQKEKKTTNEERVREMEEKMGKKMKKN